MKELYTRNSMESDEPKKRPPLSDKAIVAIRRNNLMRYFCKKWQEKYGIVYIIPPKSWVSVEMPLTEAIRSGYTDEMMQRGIETYLQNDFVGYADQSHPIKFFTGNITKWVLEAQKQGNRQKKEESENNSETRMLNEKYGILKKGDTWITEDGKVFPKPEDAIAYVTKDKSGADKKL